MQDIVLKLSGLLHTATTLFIAGRKSLAWAGSTQHLRGLQRWWYCLLKGDPPHGGRVDIRVHQQTCHEQHGHYSQRLSHSKGGHQLWTVVGDAGETTTYMTFISPIKYTGNIADYRSPVHEHPPESPRLHLGPLRSLKTSFDSSWWRSQGSAPSTLAISNHCS